MKLYTIILAAGESSRFQGIKALASWGSGTLLSHAIDQAPTENIVIVTGAHADQINAAASGTKQVYNKDWNQGMGTSIACGIAFAKDRNADVALIVPVDQPFITKEHLQKIATLCHAQQHCILTQDGNVSGPPTAIPSSAFSSLLGMKDKGLKFVIGDFVLHEGNGMLRDIDTKDELARFTQMMKTA